MPSTNPYDPTTPKAQQATAALRGQLALPQGFSWPMLLDATTIALHGFDALDEPAFTASPEADGRFQFDAVTAGDYQLRVSVPGMSSLRLDVPLPLGGEVDLGQIPLAARTDASIRGIARRAGEADDRHGGIFIELVGTPYNALTASDGAFEVQTTAGPAKLRVSTPGYETPPDLDLELRAGEAHVLGEVVTLQGAPGAIVGALVLPPGFDERALQAMGVRLFSQDEAEPHDTEAPALTSRPGDVPTTAAFGFRELAAGLWRVRVEHPSFHPYERSITLRTGEVFDLGTVVMADATITPEVGPAILLGRCRLAGRLDGEHDGTLVTVPGSPYSATTDGAGNYELIVSAARHTLHFSHPGYDSEDSASTLAVDGARTAVPEVVLVQAPGELRGSVSLDEVLAAPARVVEVQLALYRTTEAGDTLVETAAPQAAGAFAFTDLPPGAYALTLSLDGFQSRRLPAEVVAAETTFLGHTRLDGLTFTVRVHGSAHRVGRAAHEATLVRLDGTNIETTTLADGAFALLAPLRMGDYRLHFTYPGYTPEEVTVRAPDAMDLAAHVAAHGALAESVPLDRPAPGEDPLVVNLTALPGAIRGQVFLAPGFEDPVLLQTVAITLHDAVAGGPAVRETTPDPVGRYALEGVAPGAYQLRFTLPGFFALPVDFELLPGETLLAPARALDVAEAIDRVTLSGTARRACAGVCDHGGIRVETQNYPYVAFTARDGRYELQVLPRNDYVVLFSTPGYTAPALPDVDASDAGEVVVLSEVVLSALPGEVRLTLRLGEWGTPERLARATCALYDPVEDTLLRSLSPDPGGEVVFDDTAPGLYEVRCDAPGYRAIVAAAAVEPDTTTSLGGFTLDHDSVAVDAVRFGGAVLLDDRASHEGTLVRIRHADSGQSFGEAFYTTTDGRFDRPASADERYEVQVERAGYAPAPLLGPYAFDPGRGDFVDGEGLVLATELERVPVPGSIRGDVVLRTYETAARLQASTISLFTFEAPGAPAFTTRAAADGAFSFGAVPPGAWRVRFESPAYGTVERVVVLDHGEDHVFGAVVLDHESDGGAAVLLSGIVRLSDNVDAAGTTVRARIVEGDLPFGGASTTGADGRFELRASRAERYALDFSRPAYDPVPRLSPLTYDAATGVFIDGVRRPIEVTLVRTPTPGTLRGSITLRAYSSAARLQAVDVQLYADPPGGMPLRTVHPDARGDVVLSDVAPGRYELRAVAVGYEVASRRVTLEPGGDIHLGALELTHQSEGPSAVLLGGRFTLAGENTHEATTVRARIAGPDLSFGAPMLTGSDGRFELPASPAERYTFQVSHAGFVAPPNLGPFGYVPARQRFEDDAGQPIDRALARSPIQGRVQLTIDVLPAWLPNAERYGRVRLIGPVTDVRERVDTGGAGVTFDNLTEGVYTVRVERTGFRSVDQTLRLTQDTPQVVVAQPVPLRLESLSIARPDLRGHRLTMCNLREPIDGAEYISLQNADLGGVVLSGTAGGPTGCGANVRPGALDFAGADFADADLRTASFARFPNQAAVNLTDARFARTNLTGVDLTGINGTGADFFGANLTMATVAQAVLQRANFTSASLTGTRFALPRLVNGQPTFDGTPGWTDLTATAENLPNVPCGNEARPSVDLTGAVFSRAALDGTFLPGVMLRDVDFSGARITDTDLRHTCLEGARLSLLDLSSTVLDGADLRGAELTGSLLRKTRLRGTRLSDASLVGTVIDRADVRPSPRPACAALRPWADYDDDAACRLNVDSACRCRTLLDGASLDGANLVGTSFEGADMTDASLLGVTFGQVPGVSFAQPDSCEPEAYQGCLKFWEIIRPCDINGIDLDEAQAQEVCDEDPHEPGGGDGVSSEGVLCALDAFASNLGCAGYQDCLGGGLRPPQRYASPCTWASIRADEEAGRALGSACQAFGSAHRVHAPCLIAPTVLNDVRLDRARMTAVVMNGIQLDDVTLRNAVLSNAVFLDNSFGFVDLTNADVSGADLGEAVLDGLDLTNADFSGANLSGASFHETELEGTRFSEATLVGALFTRDDADPTIPGDFDLADLRGAQFHNLDWSGTPELRPSFVGADLSDAWFGNVRMDDVGFDNALFANMSMGQGNRVNSASFVNARFFNGFFSPDATSAVLSGVHFDGTLLSSANLTNAFLHDAVFQFTEGNNVRFDNASLDNAAMEHVNFDRSIFTGSRGQNMDVSFSSLLGVDMRSTSLVNGRFIDTNFSRSLQNPVQSTRFQSACLRRADFRRSNLEYAEFTNADVHSTVFQGAFMRNANLQNACNLTFFFGAFNGADLTNAQICTRDQMLFNQRNTYLGAPIWVVCPANPVCPAGCN